MKILNRSQALKQLATLVIRSQFDFFSEGKLWHIKRIPLKKKMNLLKAGFDNFFPRTVSFSQPTHLMIEPTDICNLRCTGCWANDESRRRRPRYLSIEGFKRVIDDLGDNLFIILLWGWGEPFLNKDIYEMIRLAREKDIIVISSTNANVPFDDYEIEELIKSGLSKLIVAIDGVDQETYGTYRTGGNLDLALDNVRSFVEKKERFGLETPLINMRMVVMRQNQYQVGEFRRLGESLGVDIVSFKTMCDYRKDGVNALFPTIKKYQRYAMDEESEKILDMKQRYYCNRPWRKIHVFADGAVTPCEFDFEREYLLGTIYGDQNLRALWNNSTARDFRHQFLTDINGISFCRNCTYKNQIVWDPTVEYYFLTQAAKL
jgi:radical SAM protein with 4Fe4S-binding SPASM domain